MLSMARPPIYTRELADEVLAHLREGKSLRAICTEPWAPSRQTVYEWIDANTDSFADRYGRARDVALDNLADELLAIADTPQEGVIETDKPTGKETKRADMIEHRRLQVDARKWYLAKLAPKRYGDSSKLDLTSSDGTMTPVDTPTRAARVAQLMALAQQRASAEPDDADGLV